MNLESNGLLEKIHTDALRVLEEVGVKCVSKEVRQIFENTGLAAFDEGSGHIHVLAPLIEQVLGTAPKRDRYWIPEDSFGVGGTAPFYMTIRPENWWNQPLSTWPVSQLS